VLIVGITLGLILGLLAGGSIANLSTVRLRGVAVLMFAVILRFATELLLIRGIGIVESLRLPLFLFAFVLLLATLWANRTQPGLRLAFVGILANTIAIVANAGHMPIWLPSLDAAGFTPADVSSPFHTILGPELSADFLRHAGPLADILPIPLPIIRNVASIGDVFLTAGLGFFLFATVLRSQQDEENPDVGAEGVPLSGLASAMRLPRGLQAAMGNQRLRPGTGLATGLPSGLTSTASLDRPLVLGSPGAGLAGPGAGRADEGPGIGISATAAAGALGRRPVALAPVPFGTADESALPFPGLPRIEVGARVRRHPYVRLALNGSFSALWTGQLISLFGDRVHQVALAFLVLGMTNSPLAMAMVFVAATLPNLLLSPLAGTYVDRWNQRDVMIVSDLLRAAAVLLIPIVAVTSVYLIYPFVFLITSVSIFFRPARVAILPRIVRQDELLTANSALWAGETFADIIGYPLAGIFVGYLGPALPLAFWLDAATYAASAVLIASIFVPAVRRMATTDADTGADGHGGPSGVFAEMREGLRFLRGDPVLFANTIQATFAQFAIGALTVLTPVLVRDVIADPHVEPTAAYAFLEAGIGLGNLIGGFAIGLIGARLAKGRSVILGYVLWGVSMIAVAFAGNLALAFGILFGAGIANMIFIIPSQTLFQERTPADLIGRVVSFRFALVFGSMTLAMGVGGLLAQVIGVVPVLAVSGLVSIAAGLAGLLVPEMRDA
jgi:DHA3 family macrolide efflux protein-like MFS transporter